MQANTRKFVALMPNQYSMDYYSKDDLGGKADNIKRMITSGLNVPPAINMTTGWTFDVKENGGFSRDSYFAQELNSYIRWMADRTGTTWDMNHGKPLIVSVRSGAPVSMPGMMDTILNIGLNKSNLENFASSFGGDNLFALDSYRRLIQMFGSTVCGIDNKLFQEVMDAAKIYYIEMDEEAYNRVIMQYERIFKHETGTNFPDSPNEQLIEATNAVFKSWFSNRAIEYRKIEGISDDIGTSATVQQMVFGNMNSNSGTGVVFSHNPNTGEKGLYGDFLISAQGEDVVAGTHTTQSINSMKDNPNFVNQYRQLQANMKTLLGIEQDMLDVEFTIQDGILYILQFRVAKRSRKADIRMALDNVRDGICTPEIAAEHINKLFPVGETKNSDNLTSIGSGIGCVDGIGLGKVAIGHESAEKFAAAGEQYIYIATETSPDDVRQLKNSSGILTAKGGILSHAAVVALGWGKPCVVGFEDMKVYEDYCEINGQRISIGDEIQINGTTGQVYI